MRSWSARLTRRYLAWAGVLVGWVAAVVPAQAISLQELQSNPEMTPKKFSGLFYNFDYELFEDVQPPEEFLRNQKGDCDDYACLADFVLNPKGFDTRLIHIRLAGLTSHAVCYVAGPNVYLDYNNRDVLFTLTRSTPDLRKIAQKVARSLHANWTAAFEFEYSYEEDRKRITAVVVRSQSDREEPTVQRPSPSAGPDRFRVD